LQNKQVQTKLCAGIYSIRLMNLDQFLATIYYIYFCLHVMFRAPHPNVALSSNKSEIHDNGRMFNAY